MPGAAVEADGGVLQLAGLDSAVSSWHASWATLSLPNHTFIAPPGCCLLAIPALHLLCRSRRCCCWHAGGEAGQRWSGCARCCVARCSMSCMSRRQQATAAAAATPSAKCGWWRETWTCQVWGCRQLTASWCWQRQTWCCTQQLTCHSRPTSSAHSGVCEV